MIYSAVNYVSDQLNKYLRRRHDLTKNLVVLSDLGERSAAFTDNRVVAMLVNIQRDSFPPEPVRAVARGVDRNAVTQGYRTVYINLHLMFISNFSAERYTESLKFISSIIEYFQHSAVFEREKHPDLPRDIEKLLLEMENLNLLELHNIWTLLSSKYMPSVLFKMRMLTFDGGVRGEERQIEKAEPEIIR